MEKKTVEKTTEKEYLPLLKYVAILSDKGVPVSVESVANTMAIGAIDVKRENGSWYVAKDEMLKRIKASGKKWEAVEEGYYSIHGFMYQLSLCGIDMDEDNICHLLSIGEMESKVDQYGRLTIPLHELEKRVSRFSLYK